MQAIAGSPACKHETKTRSELLADGVVEGRHSVILITIFIFLLIFTLYGYFF